MLPGWPLGCSLSLLLLLQRVLRATQGLLPILLSLLLLLLLLLFCLPGSPHSLLLLALVGAGQVAQRILQEPLIRPFTLHCPAQEGSDTLLLGPVLQLLCICCNQGCQATCCLRAHCTPTAASQPQA